MYNLDVIMLRYCLSTGLLACSTLSLAESNNAPAGYTAICTYGQTCAVTKPSLVAFGSQGQYIYKIIGGTFACSERAFNRPPSNTQTATCSVASAAKTTAPLSHVKSSADLQNGIYAIVSRLSGKALELGDNGQLRQAPYNAASKQHFALQKQKDGYYTITSQYAGSNSKSPLKTLAVKDWQTNDGAGVTTADSSQSWDQHWKITDAEPGFLAIASRFSGKTLDLYGLNTNNGAQVQLWTYWGGKNQQWQLVPITPLKTTPTTKSVVF